MDPATIAGIELAELAGLNAAAAGLVYAVWPRGERPEDVLREVRRIEQNNMEAARKRVRDSFLGSAVTITRPGSSFFAVPTGNPLFSAPIMPRGRRRSPFRRFKRRPRGGFRPRKGWGSMPLSVNPYTMAGRMEKKWLDGVGHADATIANDYGNFNLGFAQSAVPVWTVNAPAYTPNQNLFLLNGIATGTDVFNRIGRKIRIRSVHVRITVKPNISAANSNYTRSNRLKAILFCDEMPTGTAPTFSDFSANLAGQGNYSDMTVGASNQIKAFRNIANAKRFKVIKEVELVQPYTPAGSNGIQSFKGLQRIDFNVKFGGLSKLATTTYNNTSTGYTSVAQCALWCVVFADCENGAYYFDINWRTRFYDA